VSVKIGLMKFEISQNLLSKISTDVQIVFVFQNDDEKSPAYIRNADFNQIDTSLKGSLSKLALVDSFTGKSGTNISFFTNDAIVPTKVIVAGLGKQSEFILEDIRLAVGRYVSAFKKKVNSLAFAIPQEIEQDTSLLVHAMVEGALLGSYKFIKYQEKKKGEKELELITLVANEQSEMKELKKTVKKAELYAKATMLARDLVNEPPTVATPTLLASLAKDIAKGNPTVTCKVLDKEAAMKLGMEAFLGIARAADTPPKFIILEYKPEKPNKKKKLALIGKGITFDSGGINVKPGEHMSDMKMDMAGGAAVLGIFSVINEIKPEFSVLGLIAATPNMISGSSIVPGDVVRAMNGKTIEILNTDAEGRVTMADSLSYAVKEGATHILDFATLTGACMVALGTDIAGIFSNDRDLVESVKSAAFSEGEKVWELPLPKEYKSLNNSSVADIANLPSNRYGGAITAGLFLQEFVGNTPWVHFDIAGPAFSSRTHELGPKGGTGFGVRTVLQLLEQK
jgi:leucyl aminopeptidase